MTESHTEMKNIQWRRFGLAGIVLASLFGAAVSTYLLIIHYLPASRDSVLFQICSVGAFNCDRVNSGPYSELFGLPLAAYGLLFYVFVLYLIALQKKQCEKKIVGALLLAACTIAALAVFPLFALSTFVIKAFCLYCVIAWLCNFALLGLTFVVIGGEGNVLSIFRSAWNEVWENKTAIPLLASVVLFFIVAYAGVMFFSGMLHSRKQYANLKENMRMEDDAFDGYLRRRPTPVDVSGIPVYLGDPAAKVTVVEYFNFDCHVCRTASQVIKSVIDKYPGKVKLYLKHYPLDGTCNKYIAGRGDGLSCRASLIAIALHKSPKYREYVAHIMSKKERLSRETVLEALDKIGIDVDGLRALLDEKTAIKMLESHVDSGEKFGIQGTPAFIINGKVLPTGLPPARFLERIIKLEVDLAYGGKP